MGLHTNLYIPNQSMTAIECNNEKFVLSYTFETVGNGSVPNASIHLALSRYG